MIGTFTASQADFYRRFLVARTKFSPSDFGVDMERADFMDMMVNEFNESFGDTLSLDELLLRPRVAMSFCDRVRQRHNFYEDRKSVV